MTYFYKRIGKKRPWQVVSLDGEFKAVPKHLKEALGHPRPSVVPYAFGRCYTQHGQHFSVRIVVLIHPDFVNQIKTDPQVFWEGEEEVSFGISSDLGLKEESVADFVDWVDSEIINRHNKKEKQPAKITGGAGKTGSITTSIEVSVGAEITNTTVTATTRPLV